VIRRSAPPDFIEDEFQAVEKKLVTLHRVEGSNRLSMFVEPFESIAKVMQRLAKKFLIQLSLGVFVQN
jgi:hypothetical protein